MNKFFKIYALIFAVLFAAGCEKQENTKAPEVAPEVELNTDEQKAAYAIGASVGNFASQTVKQQAELGVELDSELLKKGLLDALSGESKMTEEEMGTALRAHEQKMNVLVKERAKKKSEEAIASGAKYLEENAKKEGVKVTDSGLQYEVIKEGTGPKPKPEDTVTVHYTGTLTDGTVFDSSKERGQPATFPLANVIKGWTEGVALMPVGSEYRLTIPAKLAYDDQEVGSIPAGSVLVFDVELLGIKGKGDDAKKESDAEPAAQ